LSIWSGVRVIPSADPIQARNAPIRVGLPVAPSGSGFPCPSVVGTGEASDLTIVRGRPFAPRSTRETWVASGAPVRTSRILRPASSFGSFE
jgi:hypothetical protein